MANRSKKQARNKRVLVTVIAAVCVVAVVVAGVLITKNRGESDKVSDGPLAGASEFGLTLGDADAPHQVVIYEDFLCPYCGQLEAATRESLAELAADGKVFVEYRPFWLLQSFEYSAQALNAWAVVKETSDADVTKAFHDLLFENQPSESGPFPTLDEIEDWAVEAGADRDEVSEGISTMNQTDFLTDSTQQALDAGVQGTPWVLVDGVQFSKGSTMDEIAANLIAELS